MANKTTRETFDFKQYPDVQKYLNKQSNKTKYLVDLVRKDIDNTSSEIDKEAIFSIIEEYLQTRNIVAPDKPDESIDDIKLKASALKVLNMDKI